MNIKFVSEWHWTINGKTFLIGMTYASNGKPNTYQYHLQDAGNTSGLATCGYIQGFGFETEHAAYKAGIDRYKQVFGQPATV